MKHRFAIVGFALGVGVLVWSGVPRYAVWAHAGGEAFWNRREADLFLTSRTSGWRGPYAELALQLATNYVRVGAVGPLRDERIRTFVVRCTADGIRTYEIDGVFFGALTVFEGRIQAGAQWIWTASEFIRASADQQQRFEAALAAHAGIIEIGGWSQQMLFRGLSTEAYTTLDGRPLKITSSFDDDGQRVSIVLGDGPKRDVLFAPDLKFGLSRSEYEEMLATR